MRINPAKGISREMFARALHPFLMHAFQKLTAPTDHLKRIFAKTATREGIIDSRPFPRRKIQHGRQIQIEPDQLHQPPCQTPMFVKPLLFCRLGQIFA